MDQDTQRDKVSERKNVCKTKNETQVSEKQKQIDQKRKRDREEDRRRQREGQRQSFTNGCVAGMFSIDVMTAAAGAAVTAGIAGVESPCNF